MNIIVLSIDGLHHGMLGAFGNAWIQTPTVDALACQSALFDRFYTETLRLPDIFDLYWSSGVPSGSILLTDDSDVFHHASASEFGRRELLGRPEEHTPVDELEDTQFFKALATIVDLIETRAEKSKPFFLWTHLQGFRGNWDFPLDYRRRYQDEEDPEPYAETEAPELLCADDGEIDPDDLQSVMEAYAGGVSVLDDSLAGLVDYLEENGEMDRTILIFVSTRGFSLGEHGRIGASAVLYGENIQLPLLIRFPDQTGATVRSSALVRTRDLAEFLRCFDDDPPLLRLVREEVEQLHESIFFENSDDGQRAIVTPEWFARSRRNPPNGANRYELFVKPDDLWEINDVADRCPEMLEEATAEFEKGTS